DATGRGLRVLMFDTAFHRSSSIYDNQWSNNVAYGKNQLVCSRLWQWVKANRSAARIRGGGFLRRDGLIAYGLEVRLHALFSLVRNGEDLPRPDQIRIANLILIGKIDGGVANAAAINAPGNLPERITAAYDDRSFDRLKPR